MPVSSALRMEELVWCPWPTSLVSLVALSLAACSEPQKADDTGPECEPVSEVPYDGLDQDCDGEDLTDVDGDGYVYTGVGGRDCDDQNASIHPGANEICDGIDNDCDGDTDSEDADVYDGWLLGADIAYYPTRAGSGYAASNAIYRQHLA